MDPVSILNTVVRIASCSSVGFSTQPRMVKLGARATTALGFRTRPSGNGYPSHCEFLFFLFISEDVLEILMSMLLN